MYSFVQITELLVRRIFTIFAVNCMLLNMLMPLHKANSSIESYLSSLLHENDVMDFVVRMFIGRIHRYVPISALLLFERFVVCMLLSFHKRSHKPSDRFAPLLRHERPPSPLSNLNTPFCSLLKNRQWKAEVSENMGL